MLRATTDAPTPTSDRPPSNPLAAPPATIEAACRSAQTQLQELYAQAFAAGLRHQHGQAEQALTGLVRRMLTDCAAEAADQHACEQVRSTVPAILTNRFPGIRLEQFVDHDPATFESSWSVAGYVLDLHWDYDHRGGFGDAEALTLVIWPGRAVNR